MDSPYVSCPARELAPRWNFRLPERPPRRKQPQALTKVSRGVLVVALQRLGDDPLNLPIIIAIVIVRFIPHRSVAALHDAVRPRVPRPGFDMDQVVRFDHRGNVSIDEFAAVIVSDARLLARWR